MIQDIFNSACPFAHPLISPNKIWIYYYLNQQNDLNNTDCSKIGFIWFH